MRITTSTKSSGDSAEEKSEWEERQGGGGRGGGVGGLIRFHPSVLNFTWTIVQFNILHLFPRVCSQLDYNHISCIEDGAFRALRDLEVLWVHAYSLALLTAAAEWWRLRAARRGPANDACWPLKKTPMSVWLFYRDISLGVKTLCILTNKYWWFRDMLKN